MEKTCGTCKRSTMVGRIEENGRTVKKWVRCSVTGIEHDDHHPCDVAEKPRLCEVLGVDVGERFKVRVGDGDVDGPFFIRDDGRISCPVRDIGSLDLLAALIEAINHPEKIEREPRLTPEELRRCRAFGAKWVSRDADGYQVWLWETEPELQSNGVWTGETSCAQAWDRFFPSVQPGQLIRVEDEP